MIDLHTHTTASDGRLSPADLVARAAAAGVTVLSVTDHDTTAGSEAAAAACGGAGIDFVHGIEVTAMRDDHDVHVLGYFVDPASPGLRAFLAAGRLQRIDRLRQMLDRLAALGVTIDAGAVLPGEGGDSTRSLGRPRIARALVQAGHATDVSDAFDRWLSRGRPAFVPRAAPSPEEVIVRIHEAGGIASLAHPGLLDQDAWIPELVSAGLDAIEAYYTEHDAAQTSAYLELARSLGVVISGGSDFHGDDSHAAHPGAMTLPRDAFDQLKGRVAARRASASGARISS